MNTTPQNYQLNQTSLSMSYSRLSVSHITTPSQNDGAVWNSLGSGHSATHQPLLAMNMASGYGESRPGDNVRFSPLSPGNLSPFESFDDPPLPALPDPAANLNGVLNSSDSDMLPAKQFLNQHLPPSGCQPLADVVANALGFGDSKSDRHFREFLHGLEKVRYCKYTVTFHINLQQRVGGRPYGGGHSDTTVHDGLLLPLNSEVLHADVQAQGTHKCSARCQGTPGGQFCGNKGAGCE